MKSPQWITRDDALAIHDMMLAQHGGRPGLRDTGMLDSALQRPQQLLNYGRATLPAMAAAYAGGIVRNHPFIDGNKRTGFLLAAVFLEINGRSFTATEESVVVHTLRLAAGEETEKACAAWLAESVGGCPPPARIGISVLSA